MAMSLALKWEVLSHFREKRCRKVLVEFTVGLSSFPGKRHLVEARVALLQLVPSGFLGFARSFAARVAYRWRKRKSPFSTLPLWRECC